MNSAVPDGARKKSIPFPRMAWLGFTLCYLAPAVVMLFVEIDGPGPSASRAWAQTGDFGVAPLATAIVLSPLLGLALLIVRGAQLVTDREGAGWASTITSAASPIVLVCLAVALVSPSAALFESAIRGGSALAFLAPPMVYGAWLARSRPRREIDQTI